MVSANENAASGGAPEGCPEGANGRTQPRPSFREALQRLVLLGRQLADFSKYMLAAKADSYRATVRRIAVFAVAGIVGALALATTLVVAIVLLLVGAAQGVGSALHGQWWLGDVIIGGFLVLAFGVGLLVGVMLILGWWRRKTVAKYDNRQQRQRRQFGRDVGQVARQQTK